MRITVLAFSVLITSISFGQTTEELNNVDGIIHDIWLNKQSEFVSRIETELTDTESTVLYDIQAETINLLQYACTKKDYSLMNEIAGVYNVAYSKLALIQRKEVSNASNSRIHCEVNFDQQRYAWTTGADQESVLNSSQFLYAVAKTVNHAVSLSADTLNTYPDLAYLVSHYTPVLKDHYHRWLFEDQTFQVERWTVCPEEGCYTHSDFLKMKQERLENDTLYCNAISDFDMWIIAGVTELLAAHYIKPNLVEFSIEDRLALQAYLKTGTDLLEERLLPNETSLIDFQGNEVIGLVFDKGLWSEHPDYIYAGNTQMECPSEVASVEGISWDISHARRWVHVFETMHVHRTYTGQSFPEEEVMVKLSNQFVYGVFNKNFEAPLFSNYFDGTNGWYRYEYADRDGFGYAPSDLSIAGITGGYFFWSKYNDDVGVLREAVWNMLKSDQAQNLEHIKNHYGTYFNNCVRAEKTDLTMANAFSHSTDLLKFLPTFFPCTMQEVSSVDNLVLGVVKDDKTSIYKSWRGNTLGHSIYGPNPYWDVVSMTSGDYTGNGSYELITAFDNESKVAVYKSQEGASPGSGKIYQSSKWEVVDLASGDLDGDGDDELVSARHNNAGKWVVKVGETGNIKNSERIYVTTSKQIKHIVCGDYDQDGMDEIVTVFDSLGYTLVYRSDDQMDLEGELLYQSGVWQITDIASGDLDGNGTDALISAFKNNLSEAIYVSHSGCCPGSGRVYQTTTDHIQCLSVGDFDGDGDVEVAAAFSTNAGGIISVSEKGYSPDVLKIYGPDTNFAVVQMTSGNYSGMGHGGKSRKAPGSNEEGFDTPRIIGIAPNPSNGSFRITGVNEEETAEVHIYDINGRKVDFEQNDDQISLLNQPAGALFVIVQTASETKHLKLLVY